MKFSKFRALDYKTDDDFESFWENNKFSPNARAYRDLQVENFSKIALQNEQELDFYLRGGMLECDSD